MNRYRKTIAKIVLTAGFSFGVLAHGGLIKATASSSLSDETTAEKVIDGNWISRWQAAGEGVGAWLQVTYPGPTRIGAVILVDGAGFLDNLSSVQLAFSDGSTIDYILPISKNYPGPDQPGLISTPDDMFDRNTILNAMPTAIGKKGPNDPKSGPHWIRFAPRETDFIKVTVTGLVNEQIEASFAELRWIVVPENDVQPEQKLKATPDGLRNLAFTGNGASPASGTSELSDQHAVSFLNDGVYGNVSCWISTTPDASAVIDLGKSKTIGQFWLGRDRTGQYSDRTVNSITIEVAGDDGQWQTIFKKADLNTLSGYDGTRTLLIDVEPVDARQVRLTFGPAGAGIDELEIYPPASEAPLELPRIEIMNSERAGVPPSTLYTAYGLTPGQPTEPWVLTNREFSVTISPESGTITRMTSLDPTPVDLISDGKGMTVYVRNLDRGWQEPFDQLVARRHSYGIEEGQRYEEVTCIVFPKNHMTAYARLRYRMFPDRFDVQVQYTSLIDDWCRYVFGTASELDRAAWPEHRDSAGYMPTDTAYVRSYDHAYDINWEQGDWSTLVYPMGHYKRDDRLLMYGTFNMDDHLVFAPNVPSENAHPSILTAPLGLTKGQTFTFDLFFKSFPRDTSGWMEALRWYTQRTYSYDPDFEGIPLRLTRETPTTLNPGMVGAWPVLRDSEDPAEIDRWKTKLLDLGVNNMLYGGWFLWVDSPERFDIDAVWGHLSARKMRDEIAQLKKDGFHIYTYMNNFVSAPWASHPSKGGHLVDMDNDREREWYIDRVKAMVRVLEPSGIFWDTGWWPPMYAAGNSNYSSDPRGSSVKGWVKMQAIIRRWLKENYPDMKIMVNNMAGGSPSCFFADGTMVEDAGDATNPVIVEDTRALLLTPYNYNSIFYYDQFPRVIGEEKVTRAEINEAGDLSQELRDKVWTRWVTHALKSLGLGLPVHLDVASVREKFDADAEFHVTWIPFKRSEQINELGSFSALANGTPHIAMTHVLTTDVPDAFGAVWSNLDRLMASLYNDAETRQTVTARIDRKLLGDLEPQDWSPIQSSILHAEGLAIPGRTAKVTVKKDAVTFTADLESGEVVLLTIGDK